MARVEREIQVRGEENAERIRSMQRPRRVISFVVYIVGPPCGRPVKIGISHRVQKRLQELNISHWKEEIVLHHECAVGCGVFAEKIEHTCHAELKAQGKHIRGEWFDLDAAEAFNVVRAVRSRMADDIAEAERLDSLSMKERVDELLRAVK